MNKLLCLTLMLSASANAALPAWYFNDSHSDYSLTASSCIALQNGNSTNARLISESSAKAKMVKKQNNVITGNSTLSTWENVQGQNEKYDQVISSRSQGFLSTAVLIEAGTFYDDSGNEYDCSWVGSK